MMRGVIWIRGVRLGRRCALHHPARPVHRRHAGHHLFHHAALHAHLLASIPNGYILESFANPERDPFWFELYDRKPRIEKSMLYLDATPGLGVTFNQRALERYGTKVV